MFQQLIFNTQKATVNVKTLNDLRRMVVNFYGEYTINGKSTGSVRSMAINK